jgi:hypothetical protein
LKIVAGNNIKIFCQGGLIESGQVLEYTEEQLVLGLSDNSKTIILNPNQNIIAIKVIPTSDENRSSKPEPVLVDEELKPKQYYRDQSLRAKNLVDLRTLSTVEEKKRARKLLTSKSIVNTLPEVSFGYPTSLPKHPPAKIR